MTNKDINRTARTLLLAIFLAWLIIFTAVFFFGDDKPDLHSLIKQSLNHWLYK